MSKIRMIAEIDTGNNEISNMQLEKLKEICSKEFGISKEKILTEEINCYITEINNIKNIKGLLKNPEIIYFITNKYCNGFNSHAITTQLNKKYNIKINRGTVEYWIKKYKEYICLDAIRQKEKINFSDCILIANNFEKKEMAKKKYLRRKKCSNPECNNMCHATKENSVCRECYTKGKSGKNNKRC